MVQRKNRLISTICAVALLSVILQLQNLAVHSFASDSIQFHPTFKSYNRRTRKNFGKTVTLSREDDSKPLVHYTTKTKLFLMETRGEENSSLHQDMGRSHGQTSTALYVSEKPDLAGPIEKAAAFIANAAKNFLLDAQKHDNSNPNYDTSYSGNLIDLKIMDGDVLALQVKSMVRVVLPALLWAIVGALLYPSLAMFLAGLNTYDQGVFAVLSQDASQYIQNILTSSGLMFSISVGYTYYFMYQQQEQIFMHIFAEVSEAKTLLEQLSLTCAGRPIYHQALDHMRSYLDELKLVNVLDPALSLSQRPVDDPLESLMFLTSVGKPGILYDTIKSLREARANRLAAVQRKLPFIHILLLRTLGCGVLVTFPVCGSGSQIIGGDVLLQAQAVYFGILVFGIGVVLGVIDELWNPRGGAYNVDGVLAVMIRGTEEELELRQSGRLGDSNGVKQWGLEAFPPLDDMVEFSSNDTLEEVEASGIDIETKQKKPWKSWRRRLKRA